MAVLAIVLLLFGRAAWAQTGIIVVTNKDSAIEQLSREEVAALFLGKSKFSNEIPVTTIDSDDSSLRERFYLEVANMNGLRLKAYWSRIVFSGRGRPPQEISAKEVRARLETDTGILTFIPANQATLNMKIVFSLPE